MTRRDGWDGTKRKKRKHRLRITRRNSFDRSGAVAGAAGYSDRRAGVRSADSFLACGGKGEPHRSEDIAPSSRRMSPNQAIRPKTSAAIATKNTDTEAMVGV